MAFQLKSDESVRKGVKRLVRKQIDSALEGLQGGDDCDPIVHDARKRFKKVRALLRLVRDELGEKVYRQQNTGFRDAARPLTEVRDAKVLIEALDKLTAHFAGQVTSGAFAGVREALLAEKKAIRKRVLKEEEAFRTVSEAVEPVRARVRDWSIPHKGFSAIEDGLKEVYKTGCRAFAAAATDPSVENLHEWRKQAKYLWHQLQVLEPIWAPVMKDLGDQVHELTQLLGDDHDLVVLWQKVAVDPDSYGGDSTAETLLALIDRRRQELQQEAFSLGQRVYLDRTREFASRIKGYWKAWRSQGASATQGVASPI
jgi:CHAD domain-containing protein